MVRMVIEIACLATKYKDVFLLHCRVIWLHRDFFQRDEIKPNIPSFSPIRRLYEPEASIPLFQFILILLDKYCLANYIS